MNLLNPNDAILGYVLKKRIGSGGYGEVWSAEAPGGIHKAIKFVYGFHDQERAATELRSLDRIKMVRHPFLLSLEQIQIHDGKLIVVTELAEKSLADLFGEYQAAGQYGIPREEMLSYMKDAADGLDYLVQAHHLQHLDIKPENLLLLSGHIKIADFGLVKDLSCATQSMMSGLTPAYAPPEVFDGRPHAHSDQYSLAIVYTEMLTGVRPFSGTTPAQLAAQHINSRPALQSLPSADQAVIARALSKDPNLRYPNCRAMVDELVERRGRRAIRRANPTPAQRDPNDTKPADNLGSLEMTAIVSRTRLPVQAGQIRYLDCLDDVVDTAYIGPTLVVGVGRFGGQAVQQFRQRLEQRFGSLSRLPCLGMVAIDTDRPFLSTLIDVHGDGAEGLDPGQILPIQLKTAEQYRVQTKLRLDWISRRWIYNIPRSGQTEGLRPLGRLALADHFDSIYRRLKDIASEILKPEHVALAAETCGLEPKPGAVRVILVGAASGGVGSGTLIDLAYTVRTVLSELGRQELQVLGVLAHWTPRESDLQLLAIANSLSLLNEMRHINRFGYPGDGALGIPEFEEPVFDHTYLLHLGDALSASGLQAAARTAAEYLFLNTLSECQVFFETCREGRAAQDIRSVHLKYFGMFQPDLFARLRQSLAAAVGQRWIENVVEPWPVLLQSTYEKTLQRWNLDPASLGKQGIELGRAWEQAIHDRIHEERQLAGRNWVAYLHSGRFDQLVDTLGEWSRLPLGEKSGRERTADRDQESPSLPQPDAWQAQCSRRGTDIANQLAAQVFEWVSTENVRVNGARALVERIVQALRGLIQTQQDAVAPAEQTARQLESAFADLANRKRVSAEKFSSAFDAWANAFLQWRRAEALAALIRWQITPIISRLLEIESQLTSWLGMLRQWVPAPPPSQAGTLPNQIPTTQMYWALDAKLAELVGQVDANLQRGWLNEVGGLCNVLEDPAGLGRRLERALQTACTETLAAAENDLRLADVISSAGLSMETLTDLIAHELLTSFPRLRECGGEIRALIGFWSGCFESPTEARQTLDYQSPKPTLIRHEHGDLVLCQEMQSIPLTNLVFRLMEQRADAIDLVGRLHARTDVHWTDLNELFQQASSSPGR